MTIWVIERRETKKSAWQFENAFESKRDALEYGWEPVAPVEFRLVKYRRVRKD